MGLAAICCWGLLPLNSCPTTINRVAVHLHFSLTQSYSHRPSLDMIFAFITEVIVIVPRGRWGWWRRACHMCSNLLCKLSLAASKKYNIISFAWLGRINCRCHWTWWSSGFSSITYPSATWGTMPRSFYGGVVDIGYSVLEGQSFFLTTAINRVQRVQ